MPKAIPHVRNTTSRSRLLKPIPCMNWVSGIWVVSCHSGPTLYHLTGLPSVVVTSLLQWLHSNCCECKCHVLCSLPLLPLSCCLGDESIRCGWTRIVLTYFTVTASWHGIWLGRVDRKKPYRRHLYSCSTSLISYMPKIGVHRSLSVCLSYRDSLSMQSRLPWTCNLPSFPRREDCRMTTGCVSRPGWNHNFNNHIYSTIIVTLPLGLRGW